MKKISSVVTLVFIIITSIYASEFNKWFSPGTMRLDYILAGDDTETTVYSYKILHEPYWGGSKTNLLDPFEYGDYKMEISDALTGELIFSRGFGSLFREWQTTAEAKTARKAFSNSARFPYPKRTIKLELFLRNKDQSLRSIFRIEIDPSDKQIELMSEGRNKIYKLINNGPPEKKVDIALLAEGYTKKEMKKFRNDAQRLMEHFFSVEPFKSYKQEFNVWLVMSPSLDSGTDFPGEGDWRTTIINSNFNTFGIERYLTSSDYWGISDLASSVPYDQIIILVNTENYGGGGIFNFYSITSSNNPASPGVLVHEFGHSFAGLADEYYTSDVSYEGFYDLNYEPWEPNITTLKKFSNKWEDMVDQGVPVPTPAVVKYDGITGVFEGGGYMAKGIFRPQINCIMKSNSADKFCDVCNRAFERMIKYYSE